MEKYNMTVSNTKQNQRKLLFPYHLLTYYVTPKLTKHKTLPIMPVIIIHVHGSKSKEIFFTPMTSEVIFTFCTHVLTRMVLELLNNIETLV